MMMRRAFSRHSRLGRPWLAILGVLLLASACHGSAVTAAPRPVATVSGATRPVAPAARATPLPTATERVRSTATPTPALPVTRTASLPSPTPARSIVPVVTTATGVTIDVVSVGHQRITPGQSATVPVGNGEIDLLVHYPISLWASEGAHPYPITVTVNPSDWRPIVGNWANDRTLTLHLYGRATGRHVVTVVVNGGRIPTVSVTLNVVLAPGTTPTPQVSLTITHDDDGRTIDLRTGQTFQLELGDQLNWQVAVADPSIVSPVATAMLPKGVQGVYQAQRPGQTTLTAIGSPICRPGEACPAFRVRFSVELLVR